MLNNSSNLYGSEWLALVFNNRNKNYGAYVLRTQSSNILLKSLFIVAPIFIFLFVGPLLYGQLGDEPTVEPFKETEVKIADRIYETKKEEPKKEELKKEEAAPLKKETVATKKFIANIKIVEETTDVPPTTADLKNAAIGSETQVGTPATGNAEPASQTVGGNGDATAGVAVSTTEIFDSSGVEVYPEFPGGMEAWARFIIKNLRYPYAAQDMNIQGKVYVSFVVERDGSISDVKVVRGIGYGCDDEAVRVIKKSPKWKAGMQNKQAVRVRYQMPISYTLAQ